MWLIVGLTVIAAGVLARLVFFDGSGEGGETTGASNRARDLYDNLVASPHSLALDLAVEVPEGSESDNPGKQVIEAEGSFDFVSGAGDVTYDFKELNNAAGFLGHFETLEALFTEKEIYLEIFKSGPPWMRFRPEDIGTGDVLRLREIFMTAPYMLPALLDVPGTEEEEDAGRWTRSVDVAALADSEDPFAAAAGEVLEGWNTDTVELRVVQVGSAPLQMILSFVHAPSGSGEITVNATYELSPEDEVPEVDPPTGDDVRDLSDFLG